MDVQDLLRFQVDIVTEAGLHSAFRQRVLQEAKRLWPTHRPTISLCSTTSSLASGASESTQVQAGPPYFVSLMVQDAVSHLQTLTESTQRLSQAAKDAEPTVP